MSLPTNTWISVDKADELPKFNEVWSHPIDCCIDGYRWADAQYNFHTREFYHDQHITPTHFMIIELPK